MKSGCPPWLVVIIVTLVLSGCGARTFPPVSPDGACSIVVAQGREARIVFPRILRDGWYREFPDSSSAAANNAVWSVYFYGASVGGLHVTFLDIPFRGAGDGSLEDYVSQAQVIFTWPSSSPAYEFDDYEMVPNLQPTVVGGRVAVFVRDAASLEALFASRPDTVRCDFVGRDSEESEQWAAVQYVK